MTDARRHDAELRRRIAYMAERIAELDGHKEDEPADWAAAAARVIGAAREVCAHVRGETC